MAIRIQTAKISNFHNDDSGVMHVTAIARHPGVLTYRTDAGERRELVTPDFIRQLDGNDFPFIGQLGNAPVTHEHPNRLIRTDSVEAMLPTEGDQALPLVAKFDSNPNGLQVGKVKPQVKVYADGQVKVEMEVTNPLTQDAIRKGELRGTSMGYQCNVVREDGVFGGQRYTHKQTAPLKIDHLAIVANPRAPEALITKFDASSDSDWGVSCYEDPPINWISVANVDGADLKGEGEGDCKPCKDKEASMDAANLEKLTEDIADRVLRTIQDSDDEYIVILGGGQVSLDSELVSALWEDGVIDVVKLDSDTEFLAGMDFISALWEDGVIEPLSHYDAKCGRGWIGQKGNCKRAGKKAAKRRVSEAKRTGLGDENRAKKGLQSRRTKKTRARSKALKKKFGSDPSASARGANKAREKGAKYNEKAFSERMKKGKYAKGSRYQEFSEKAAAADEVGLNVGESAAARRASRYKAGKVISGNTARRRTLTARAGEKSRRYGNRALNIREEKGKYNPEYEEASRKSGNAASLLEEGSLSRSAARSVKRNAGRRRKKSA